MVVFGSLFILFGAALLFGGVILVRLGGSSYYAIVGIGLIASGIQLHRGGCGTGEWPGRQHELSTADRSDTALMFVACKPD